MASWLGTWRCSVSSPCFNSVTGTAETPEVGKNALERIVKKNVSPQNMVFETNPPIHHIHTVMLHEVCKISNPQFFKQ